MKDIEIAKKILEEQNLCITVVKDGGLIYKSEDKGIKPMYTLATEMKDDLKGASIADRVIGRGAAILCSYVGVKKVYGKLISQSAMEVLKDREIEYDYEKSCPYIENMDRTDMCPIEKLSLDVEDGDVLIDRIKDFLNK